MCPGSHGPPRPAACPRWASRWPLLLSEVRAECGSVLLSSPSHSTAGSAQRSLFDLFDKGAEITPRPLCLAAQTQPSAAWVCK